MIDYLNTHNIDIIFLQETKVKHKGTEKEVTLFFIPAKPPPNPIYHQKNLNTSLK